MDKFQIFKIRESELIFGGELFSTYWTADGQNYSVDLFDSETGNFISMPL